ncbi:hypothetical protein AGMMS49982_24080 [Bacteroidia bacterium]|nr:hypothetical protein AGMMS49982_24080 [Bacteroidia bacterium]
MSVALFAATTVFAQELTNKAGVPILPKQGDFAVGIDADPFLNYVGKLFSNAGATAPVLQVKDGFTVSGKYFLDDKTAVRAKLKFNYSSDTDVDYVGNSDWTATGDQTEADRPKVEDETTTSSLGFGLGAGLEKRLGNSRLQFFYGAELGLGIGWNGDKAYTYGNALKSTDTGTQRLEDNNGTTFSFGVGAFAGVEYFVAPRISIGGEFGWGLSYSSTGQGSTVDKIADGTKVTEKTTDGDSSSSAFSLQNAPSGHLSINFYF